MSKKILMPKALTAENGAKAKLIGEFIEWITVECPSCGGIDLDEKSCDLCESKGVVQQPVQVSWTTIKEIYAIAVKRLGEDQGDEIGEAKAEMRNEIITYLRESAEQVGCSICEARALNTAADSIERVF